MNGADYVTLDLPQVGTNGLKVLTPTMLELKLIDTQASASSPVSAWNLVDSGGNFSSPGTGAFTVTANGQPIPVTAIGFKRRPIYAPFEMYDLRIENNLYLQLGSPIASATNMVVEVKNPSGSLWSSNTKFITTTDPCRW